MSKIIPKNDKKYPQKLLKITPKMTKNVPKNDQKHPKK